MATKIKRGHSPVPGVLASTSILSRNGRAVQGTGAAIRKDSTQRKEAASVSAYATNFVSQPIPAPATPIFRAGKQTSGEIKHESVFHEPGAGERGEGIKLPNEPHSIYLNLLMVCLYVLMAVGLAMVCLSLYNIASAILSNLDNGATTILYGGLLCAVA